MVQAYQNKKFLLYQETVATYQMSRLVKDTVISFLPISNSSLILTLVLISLLEVKNSEFRTKPQYSQMLK